MDTAAFNQEVTKATAGDLKAMNNVADAYFRGKDVPKDLAKSLEWFQRAADAGNGYALYRLGLAYQNGWGCAQDYDAAIKSLKTSVDKGGTSGCKNLCTIYSDKEGPCFNRHAVEVYARIGIEAGCDTCAYILGKIYFDDLDRRGMPLLRSAAEKGNAKAMVMLGDAYINGWSVKEDHNEAFAWFTKAANTGDAQGNYSLANANWYGWGCQKNLIVAAACMEKAREGGLLKACERLYSLYTTKSDAVYDEAKAVAALEFGIERGDRECELRMGKRYLDLKEYVKGLQILETCAVLGPTDPIGSMALQALGSYYLSSYGNDKARAIGYFAQIMRNYRDYPMSSVDDIVVYYALCLFLGEGCSRNPAAAMATLKMAAEVGNSTSRDLLQKKKLTGHPARYSQFIFGAALAPAPATFEEDIVIDLSPFLDSMESIPAAKVPPTRRVFLLQQKAEKGEPEAQYMLAKALLGGREVEKDPELAVGWLLKAAGKDHLQAQLTLAMCYSTAWGVAKDETKDGYWRAKAASLGHPESQYNLGTFYFTGTHGMRKDLASAARWTQEAAKNGNLGAQNFLGDLYYNGWGVPKNQTEAVKWYGNAAAAGEKNAQFMMGECLRLGTGIARNTTASRTWYVKAAEQGHEKAKAQL